MRFPFELISEILREAIVSKDIEDTFSKAIWGQINGIFETSKLFRTLALNFWFEVLHIGETADWQAIGSSCSFIYQKARVVQVCATVYDSPTDKLREILKFKNVTALRIVAVPHHAGENVLDLDFLWLPVPRQVPQIRRLELRDFPYPEPSLVRWVATFFPGLQVLALRQPAAWCDQCYTCVLPSLAAPIPDQIVYNDVRGLPEIYARFLMPLENLHTVILTVGVEQGKLAVDSGDSGHWVGECTGCRQLARVDEAYRIRYLEKKNNPKVFLPNIKRVEWHFIKEIDAAWNEMIAEHVLQEERQTVFQLDPTTDEI